MIARRRAQLGTYDPIAGRDGIKEVRLKTDRVKYWLGEGAQMTDTVARLLSEVGIVPRPPARLHTVKCMPREKGKGAGGGGGAPAKAAPAKGAAAAPAKAAKGKAGFHTDARAGFETAAAPAAVLGGVGAGKDAR